MKVSSKEVPLKKLWRANLVLSVLFHICLLVISITSRNPVFFVLCYFVTFLSSLILFDWKYLTLILNIFIQVFSIVSSLYICFSPKIPESSFKARWHKDSLKWMFPLVCFHSVSVSVTIICLKRKYNVNDEFPLSDVISVLKNPEPYFRECKELKEKLLENQKIAQRMRMIEIRKEEEVAKKIVDSLYSFTNRSNFPELETRTNRTTGSNIMDKYKVERSNFNEFSQDMEVKYIGNDANFNFHISIPEEMESVDSISWVNDTTNRNSNEKLDESNDSN
ncbi:uncharacterized protein TA15795 [Theileria annulata]|uniref:Uncharacterized protein n=1 Tax=Theileria annulata TaxID=5874 RepID=Q4UFP2_THEAN|nr:uncharacterized protein TA15795 [Theileria annulata]CAI74074.1 hypothetical protein TA15795 [Theileria annulata]|eukprot:XP_951806.1 hypothetical protein TA15795 [Theileria annulata]